MLFRSLNTPTRIILPKFETVRLKSHILNFDSEVGDFITVKANLTPIPDSVRYAGFNFKQYCFLEQIQALGTIKPVGEAMGAANAAKNLFSHQEKPITPSPMMTPMPNSNLGQMVSGMQQQQANQMAQDEQMRMMRRKARGFA